MTKDETDEQEDHEMDDQIFKTLYRNSPFFKYYESIMKEIESLNDSCKNKTKNIYYNEKFNKKFHQQYLAFLPFWTVFISKALNENAKFNNNGRIEQSFNVLKNDCEADKELPRLGSIKIGNYSKFRFHQIESKLNEIDAEQRLIHLETQPISAEEDTIKDSSQSEEKWDKPRRSKYGEAARKVLAKAFGGEIN